MERTKRWYELGVVTFFALALVFGAFVMPAIAAEKAKAEKMTVTGTVVEMGKDKKGHAYFGIKTDAGDYEVSKKGKGGELAKMVNKKVEATGTVSESKGHKVIHVEGYKAMK